MDEQTSRTSPGRTSTDMQRGNRDLTPGTNQRTARPPRVCVCRPRPLHALFTVLLLRLILEWKDAHQQRCGCHRRRRGQGV